MWYIYIKLLLVKGGVFLEDIEIAKNAKMKNIKEIAEKININEEYIEQYGKYKAKINLDIFKKLENEKMQLLLYRKFRWWKV